MGRRKGEAKAPTRPIRVHEDVATLVDKLAPIFSQTGPDFVSGLLRPLLYQKRQEAAELLLKEENGGRRPKRRKAE